LQIWNNRRSESPIRREFPDERSNQRRSEEIALENQSLIDRFGMLVRYTKELRQFELKSRQMTEEGNRNPTNPVCGEEKSCSEEILLT